MKHLTTSADAQTLLIIPRSYAIEGSLVIRDESTNTETSDVVTLGKTGEYMSLSHSFSLIEGRYYNFKIVVAGEVIYKDKIFCTDQDIDQSNNDYYSVNDGDYITEDSYNNDYIVI